MLEILWKDVKHGGGETGSDQLMNGGAGGGGVAELVWTLEKGLPRR